MPIAAVGDPHIVYFMNPVEAPAAKTHHWLGGIRQIRQASLTADFSGKLNLSPNKRIRESKMGNSFYAKLCFPYRQIGKRKAKDDG